MREANVSGADVPLMSNPTVSVIIPVWKSERYVAETIRSVLGQTFEDFEVLIVDDGSPDGSLDICRGFSDPRIHYFRQENRGLAAARNTGLRHARGEFIAFLDSDDMWAPDKLERHVAHLRSSPDVGVSFCYSVFVDEHGNRLGRYQRYGPREATSAHCICQNPIGNGSNAVVRAEVLGLRNRSTATARAPEYLFDEELRQAEDFELWVRIAATTDWKIRRIPWPLTLYRIHREGLSSDVVLQRHYHLCALVKIHSYAPELAQAFRTRSIAYLYWHLGRILLDQRRAREARTAVRCALTYDPSTFRFNELLLSVAVAMHSVTPPGVFSFCFRHGSRVFARWQEWRIRREQTLGVVERERDTGREESPAATAQ